MILSVNATALISPVNAGILISVSFLAGISIYIFCLFLQEEKSLSGFLVHYYFPLQSCSEGTPENAQGIGM